MSVYLLVNTNQPIIEGLLPSGSGVKESACNAGDLGWEDPLKKGMTTHSSILAWRFPWTEEPGGIQSMESQRVGHDGTTNTFSHIIKLIFSKCMF